jgi:hypothetical protein
MAGSGGGADLGDPKSALQNVCNMFHLSPCPLQLPTVNQLIVENAALSGSTPAEVRQTVASGVAVDAGNQSSFYYQPGQPLDGTPMPYTALANPLAFISSSTKQGQPVPTQPSDPAVNAFLSAVTTSIGEANLDTLDLTFNYGLRTNSPFTVNQDVGDITLPFTIEDINGNVLRDPLATLHIIGAGGVCPGPTCITTQIVGDLKGTGTSQIYALSELGIALSLDFSGSGGSEVFDLKIPLIGVGNLLTFPATGHEFDMTSGLFDGINPIASFLNASFLDNADNLLAAFNADLAIAFDGSTIMSDPVPMLEPSSLALLGSGLLWLELLRRRLSPRQIDPVARRAVRGS